MHLWWATARRCSHMSLAYPSNEWDITCTILITGVYSEPRQISKIELFSWIVRLFQPLTIFAKDSISDVRRGSVYVSALYVCLCRVGREWRFLIWSDAKAWGECLTTKWEGNYQTIKLWYLSPDSWMSGCNVGLKSPMRMVLMGVVWIVGRFLADNFFAGLFFQKIAAQMDGKVGALFPLRVVCLICTRCVTVRRVCMKGSS